MKRSAIALFSMLAVCTMSAQAAECSAPVLPAHSTSTEGVNRIVKKVQQWRACQVGQQSSVDAERKQAAFEVKLAKWERATRMYSNGQALGALSQISIDRDRSEHLAAATNPQPQVFGSERR